MLNHKRVERLWREEGLNVSGTSSQRDDYGWMTFLVYGYGPYLYPNQDTNSYIGTNNGGWSVMGLKNKIGQ